MEPKLTKHNLRILMGAVEESWLEIDVPTWPARLGLV